MKNTQLQNISIQIKTSQSKLTSFSHDTFEGILFNFISSKTPYRTNILRLVLLKIQNKTKTKHHFIRGNTSKNKKNNNNNYTTHKIDLCKKQFSPKFRGQSLFPTAPLFLLFFLLLLFLSSLFQLFPFSPENESSGLPSSSSSSSSLSKPIYHYKYLYYYYFISIIRKVSRNQFKISIIQFLITNIINSPFVDRRRFLSNNISPFHIMEFLPCTLSRSSNSTFSSATEAEAATSSPSLYSSNIKDASSFNKVESSLSSPILSAQTALSFSPIINNSTELETIKSSPKSHQHSRMKLTNSFGSSIYPYPSPNSSRQASPEPFNLYTNNTNNTTNKTNNDSKNTNQNIDNTTTNNNNNKLINNYGKWKTSSHSYSSPSTRTSSSSYGGSSASGSRSKSSSSQSGSSLPSKDQKDKDKHGGGGDKDENKPTKVRQRTAIACNYCRRRKVCKKTKKITLFYFFSSFVFFFLMLLLSTNQTYILFIDSMFWFSTIRSN